MEDSVYIRNQLIRPRYANLYASSRKIQDVLHRTKLGQEEWIRVRWFVVVYPDIVWMDSFCYESEEFLMARQKSEWQFINIKLTREHKADLDKFIKSYQADPFLILEELGARAYKLSVSFVDKQNSWVVSVSGTENSKLNNGCTMTSWSDSIQEAIFMAGYKVLALTQEGKWEDFQEVASNWG